MTTNSYTPGPWKARQLFHAYEPGRSLGWIVETENGSRIGWADYGDADTNKGEESPHLISASNARLIAAAPELVAALEALAEVTDDFSPSLSDYIQRHEKVVQQARALLARVRGESTGGEG